MLAFKKLGHVFCPDGTIPRMRTHASNPVVTHVKEDLFRVYFGSRDDLQRTHIWFLDMYLKDEEFKIIGLSSGPVLVPGVLGAFDDSGVSIGCVLKNGENTWLYYMGWNLGVTVPWRNSIGLAVISPESSEAKRTSPVPMIDRNVHDPFTISYPCVIRDGSIWKMWYGSNLTWGAQQSDMNHVIKYAWSADGVQWNVEGAISLNLKLPEEYALCRPWVLKENGLFKMWFCYRGDAYRIGYAESSNGITFARKAGPIVDVSSSGWDSEMVAYPSLIRHGRNLYLFYNGNHYGKTGFGLAVLKSGGI